MFLNATCEAYIREVSRTKAELKSAEEKHDSLSAELMHSREQLTLMVSEVHRLSANPDEIQALNAYLAGVFTPANVAHDSMVYRLGELDRKINAIRERMGGEEFIEMSTIATRSEKVLLSEKKNLDEVSQALDANDGERTAVLCKLGACLPYDDCFHHGGNNFNVGDIAGIHLNEGGRTMTHSVIHPCVVLKLVGSVDGMTGDPFIACVVCFLNEDRGLDFRFVRQDRLRNPPRSAARV